MQLHVDPPGDMTEGSLAGLRDEPFLHFLSRSVFVFGRRLLFDIVIVRKRKKKDRWRMECGALVLVNGEAQLLQLFLDGVKLASAMNGGV